MGSCEKDGKSGNGEVVASVVSATETLVVIKIDEADGYATVLDALKSLEEAGELTFDSKESQYGAYIVSVNGKVEISELTEGFSWMVYTSDCTEGVANTEGEPLVWQEKNHYSVLLGVSFLKVKEGEYYLLNFEGWSYP